MAQKSQVETKEILLKAFTKHFIISENELVTLTSATVPVNDEFFALFSRAKKIQKDCEILLGAKNQQLGLEIMEQTSDSLNGGFQKLHRWIQREFKYLNLENPHITSSIRRSLRVLAERPSLFHNSLGSLSESRESVLSDSFYSALSGSSVSGERSTPVKPIELAAHDPLRYVGDMLAWTHSATVSEKEALSVLFISDSEEIAKGIQMGRINEPWGQLSEDETESSNFDGIKALNKVVDRNFNGVAVVLRQRIGQLIQSHEETITAYKIANLLNFYRITFSKLLDDSSDLVKSLSTLEESALKQFRMLIRDDVANLQSDYQVASENLEPPEFLCESFKKLTEIMRTYESLYASVDSREADFGSILDDAFDPFMSRCEEITKDLLTPTDTIFYMNCLLAAKKTLSPFNFTGQKLSTLEEKIEIYTARLVEHQYSYLQCKSGLQSLMCSLASLPCSKIDPKLIQSLEPLQPNALIKASESLDNFLPSALIDSMENLRLLQDSILARKITEEALQKFCLNFEFIEQKLTEVDKLWERIGNEADDRSLREIFPRTSDEIRVLLA